MAFQALRQRPAAIIGTAAFAGVGLTLFARMTIQKAAADSGEPPKVFGSGPAFVSLRLESSEDVNHNTKRLRFSFPQSNAVSGLGLTSALLTYSWPKGRMFPVVRPYTPINSLDEQGSLEFMIKRYPDGKQSTHIHSLTPGDTLRFIVKIPGYNWKPNEHEHVTMIAGGAGITPMYQLIRGIIRNPADQTKITLVFGVNTDEDVLLKKEFDSYASDFPGRFNAVYTVSNPVAGSPYRKGYVTKELLKEVMLSESGGEGGTSKVFVCGPPAMEEALVGKKGTGGILGELGYGKDKVYRF